MVETITVFVGFDPREAVAYHVCCQSIIERSSMPLEIHPLHLGLFKDYTETHTDGSNAFIYSRFLVPWLMEWRGWAIFLDGDMIVEEDIAKLWGKRDLYKAAMVVKHDYKTKFPVKYLGNRNEDYLRKNWSSVVLWNCGHFGNRVLSPEYIGKASGSHLHRFGWLPDEQIGELPSTWNRLVLEQESTEEDKLLHFTVGIPAFEEYNHGPEAEKWRLEYSKTIKPK